MNQLNFHNLNSSFKPPPRGVLPIIQKLIAIYKTWHEYKNHLPRSARYALGVKIDNYFIKILELLFIASYLNKQQKLPYLQKANIELDLLKFFLMILWELKLLDNKKYIIFSESLDEFGRMLGGWQRGLLKETPAQ